MLTTLSFGILFHLLGLNAATMAIILLLFILVVVVIIFILRSL